MDFEQVTKSISTLNDLKRVANAYVFDYKSLDRQELVDALIKTKKQYYDNDNVKKSYTACIFNDNRNIRILAPIILKQVVLNKDGYILDCRSVNEEVIKYEQLIINKAAEFAIAKNLYNKDQLDLMKFVLEAAWENDDNISQDEKRLLTKIQHKLGVSDEEYKVLQAQLGMFPQKKNMLHSNDQIIEVKKELQRLGLLFQVRDDDGVDCDCIPEELAYTLRSLFGIEMKQSGYARLIDNKRLKLKDYLLGIIDRSGVSYPKNMQVKEMKQFILDNIKPSNLLGGFSARDGLNTSDLIEWSKELGLTTNKTKDALISQIIQHYDEYKEIEVTDEDPRKIYFDNYELLAGRKIEELRKKGVIQKDLECERAFEKATHYIFESYLNVQPIQQMKGSEHPDGVLAFNDKLIMWDNKSKETDVNLKDHIVQFDRYIKSSEKPVAVFLVIGPSFTDNSIQVQTQYQLTSDTLITMISADQLKDMAIRWNKAKGKEAFPLGYFRQSGKFITSIIEY